MNQFNHFEHFKRMLFSYPDCKTSIINAKHFVLIGNEMVDIFGRKPDLFSAIEIKRLGGSAELTFLNNSVNEYFKKDSTIYVCNTLQSRVVAAGLKCFGITKCIDITHLNHRFTSIVDTEILKKNLSKIKKVFSLLHDDESKRVFLSILLFRVTKDPSRIPSSPYQQYLHPEIKFNENDTIIDGGAFEGESAFLFLNKIRAKAKIYSFEPQVDNYRKLVENVDRYKLTDYIIPIRCGLWSSTRSLQFVEANNCSHIIENGASSISVVSIDKYFEKKGRIDLIKLDVEGAEVEALDGAEHTISKYRPTMILCVYHKGDHIWKIPLMIEEKYGNYSYYLGHHSPDLTVYETVLYAIPNEKAS